MTTPPVTNGERELDIWCARLLGWSEAPTPIVLGGVPGAVRIVGAGDVYQSDPGIWFELPSGWARQIELSTSYEGMGFILDWLKANVAEPEDHAFIGHQPDNEDPAYGLGERFRGGWFADITHDLRNGAVYGQPSLPLAVALAARAAIEGEK